MVLGLRRDERREVGRVDDAGRLGDAPALEVRAADVAQLAVAHEVVEGAQRLVERRRRVRPVQLVEVDVVRAEPPQRALEGVDDVPPRRALAQLPRRGVGCGCALGGVARALEDARAIEGRALAGGARELGGDDRLVAAAAQRLADVLLGAPGRPLAARGRGIDVRGVEQVHAGVERVRDHLARVCEVPAPAEVVAAQPDDRDLEAGAAELAVLHRLLQAPAVSAAPRSAR